MKLFVKLFNFLGNYKLSHVNWWSTWLFNLRYFPLRTALKLPVFIYNRTKVYNLSTLELETNRIYKGMVRIGCNPVKATGNTKIFFTGKLVIRGSLDIWGGSIIEGTGTLDFGDCVMLGENCRIMCCEHIIFGNYIRVGFDCIFMDTDFHYIIDTQNLQVRRNTALVEVGSGSWISSNCKIMKGTRLPKASIVSGGSMVNKDFSGEQPCTIFVGVPAKPVKHGFRRIFNTKVEDALNEYFHANPRAMSCELVDELTTSDLDNFCCSQFFRNR